MIDSTLVNPDTLNVVTQVVTSPTVAYTTAASVLASALYLVIPDKRISGIIRAIGVIVDIVSLNWYRFRKDKKK